MNTFGGADIMSSFSYKHPKQKPIPQSGRKLKYEQMCGRGLLNLGGVLHSPSALFCFLLLKLIGFISSNTRTVHFLLYTDSSFISYSVSLRVRTLFSISICLIKVVLDCDLYHSIVLSLCLG